jgi:hypothetical protein
LHFLSRHIKELGIVLSYTIMLVACVFFDWEVFAIFVSFLIEIVVLFVVYAILHIKYNKQLSDLVISILHLIMVIIGMIPLLLFHLFIIGLLANMFDPEIDVFKNNLLNTKEVFYAAGSMLLFYAINVFQISSHKNKVIIYQNTIIIQVLLLTVSNIVAFSAVFILGLNSLFVVLTAMVISRIFMEFYFLNLEEK